MYSIYFFFNFKVASSLTTNITQIFNGYFRIIVFNLHYELCLF